MSRPRTEQTESGRDGVKAEAVAALRGAGFAVLILPVTGPHGGKRLMPTGTPDAIVLVGRGRFFWAEFKRARGGRFSPEQLQFRRAALARGEKWIAPTSAGEAIRFAVHVMQGE